MRDSKSVEPTFDCVVLQHDLCGQDGSDEDRVTREELTADLWRRPWTVCVRIPHAEKQKRKKDFLHDPMLRSADLVIKLKSV
jgi:hypothetical protein